MIIKQSDIKYTHNPYASLHVDYTPPGGWPESLEGIVWGLQNKTALNDTQNEQANKEKPA